MRDLFEKVNIFFVFLILFIQFRNFLFDIIKFS
jgi:hypothetical protein